LVNLNIILSQRASTRTMQFRRTLTVEQEVGGSSPPNCTSASRKTSHPYVPPLAASPDRRYRRRNPIIVSGKITGGDVEISNRRDLYFPLRARRCPRAGA